MIRRFAGRLLRALDLDGERVRYTLACSIGWHRPGVIRSKGLFYPTDCVKRGCPVYIASRELLSNATDSEG